jgi:DNA (cytosine-5)-methyltransferase 1
MVGAADSDAVCRARVGGRVLADLGCAMSVYYNEFDREKAEWLRYLMRLRVIPGGEVDERSIEEVKPEEIRGFHQCHWFAGIGIWAYALRLAGWPDDQEIWSASCPCQPFSTAGKGEGFGDSRHLWPRLSFLIDSRHPQCILGEQVSSADGLMWFDLVQNDMGRAGYTCGGLDTCAAGAGAPHIRQRLYWGARLADSAQRAKRAHNRESIAGGERARPVGRFGLSVGLAESSGEGLEKRSNFGEEQEQPAFIGNCGFGGLEHSAGDGWDERRAESSGRESAGRCGVSGVGDAAGKRRRKARGRGRRSEKRASFGSIVNPWAGSDWVLTRAERVGDLPGLRPVEPGALSLVDGLAARMGYSGRVGFPLSAGEKARVLRLKGYGDGIAAPQAALFVRACMDEWGIE